MPATIAIFRTVGAAFVGVSRSTRVLAPRALPPLVASIAFAILREHLFEPHELLLAPAQLYSIVAAVPAAFFAFASHTICLGTLNNGGVNPAGSRVVPFVALILAGLAMFATVEILAPGFAFGPSGELADAGGAASALNFALTISSVAIAVRCSLVLPATAAGERPDLRRAWARSRGISWPLFWACAMAPCAVFLPVLILLQMNGLLLIPGAEQLPALAPTRVAVNVALGITTYIAVSLGAFALCHIYVRVRSDAPAA